MIEVRCSDKIHAEAAAAIIGAKFKHAEPMVCSDDDGWSVAIHDDYIEQAQRALKEAGEALIEMSEC